MATFFLSYTPEDYDGYTKVVDEGKSQILTNRALYAYPLITSCGGMVTAAAFSEIKETTEAFLKTTKFRKLLKKNPSLLWVETGSIVLITIQIAFVIGPILGGALYGQYGISSAAIIMSIFGGVVCLIFALLSVCI